MKIIGKLLLLVGLIHLFLAVHTSAEISLQSQIDAAPEGSTLLVKKGIYDESIVIKKPITLVGEKGAIFKTCSSQPVITITGQNVNLTGIHIVNCKKSPAAIYINGKDHHLEDVTIHSVNVGMKLENVNKASFRQIHISGLGKANAIDLWESHQNTFEDISIDKVQDGFYMENSHYNTFIGNTISDSRYGLHVMFSDYITVIKNRSTRNITGAMIMGTNHSVITNNRLIENNQNVNAQGLLLYDVHDSTIKGNQISQNRVGLFMENSSGNEIEGNKFAANFVGSQLNKINKNMIEGNIFISNVTDVQATKGTENLIRKNYWDAALKLDTDGDGNSNLVHRADPFFLNLTKETPPYQLFFQHPGLVLLQKMLKSPEHLLVTDEEPLMNHASHHKDQTEANNSHFWSISLGMIIISLIIIYFGRKKV